MDEEFMEVDEILKEVESISLRNHNSRSGLSYQRRQKFKATRATDELSKIAYLVDSHVPSLRERAAMRYERILMKDECEESREQLKVFKNIITTKCSTNLEEGIDEIRKQIAEMPKEWTIVQLTSQFDPLEYPNLDAKSYQTNGLHIIVFNCGQIDVDPFLVTVDPPSHAGSKLELLQELMNTLDENNERLSKTSKRKFFKDRREKYDYMLKSEDTQMTLMGIVKKIEESWLREWRCLLVGKYQNNLIQQNIKFELENILKNQLGDANISQRSKDLLFHVAKGTKYLNQIEILRAVQYCLEGIDDENLKEVCRLIKEMNVGMNNQYEELLRHPVILVVDESLDSFPWEMMEVLKDEPVSRIPSLHFAYLLFKVHEKEIEDGHKIMTSQNGKYVINPDGDLVQMEARMKSFFQYWLPGWNGINDRRPTNEEFYNLLKNADIFLYSGHGSGTHIMTVEMLQKMNINAVVLLFGCASTRIARLGTQVEMYGSYHMYLISRCPCVLGMLWPVTDMCTDILTTEFLSRWIPSDAPIPWTNVDKQQWLQAAKCNTFTTNNKNIENSLNNLELLRALIKSKKVTENYFTKAACVVRGLPVKIKLK